MAKAKGLHIVVLLYKQGGKVCSNMMYLVCRRIVLSLALDL